MPLTGDIGQLLRKRRTERLLTGLSQGLLQAGTQGSGLLSGLGRAVGQANAYGGGGNDIAEIAALTSLQRQQEADRQRKAQGEAFTTGLGTAEAPGRLAQGLTPQQIGLLQSVGPQAGMGLLAKQAFQKPTPAPEAFTTVQNPFGRGGVGQRSSTTDKVVNYRPPAKDPTPLAIVRKMELAGIEPNSEEGQAIIRADLAGQQVNVTTDANGATQVSIGKGVAGSGLENKTRSDIEGDLFKARESLARLETITAGFKPEFQQFDTRFGAAWTAFKEKFGSLPGIPDEVPVQDRKVLREFTIYRRDAIDNINKHIKDATGATMGVDEAKRIRAGVPDAGEGIFDGDSPTEFKAKLDGTVRALKMATARQSYALRNGLDWREIDLEEIENIMRERMIEIEQEVTTRNPNMGATALQRLLSHTLGVEFGLLGDD